MHHGKSIHDIHKVVRNPRLNPECSHNGFFTILELQLIAIVLNMHEDCLEIQGQYFTVECWGLKDLLVGKKYQELWANISSASFFKK